MAAPRHRPPDGRGLARAARRAEVRRLFLEVASDNDPAIALYKSLGFKTAGRRKAYYQRGAGESVDAIILALTL
ncbi:MAG: GNAT family N-acetyltransferase [Hyphomicrobium sp.]|nr:GNAT family N-acetyltransferase [Hyphomicrobium sp.]